MKRGLWIGPALCAVILANPAHADPRLVNHPYKSDEVVHIQGRLNVQATIEFGNDEFNYINKYCEEKPVDWSISVWDLDSLDFALQYNLPLFRGFLSAMHGRTGTKRLYDKHNIGLFIFSILF